MDDTAKHWYALRVTYARELKVKSFFDDIDVESFIPMQCIELPAAGRRKRKAIVPAVHNLIFVNIETERLKQIKRHTSLPICYIMNPTDKRPVIIDDRSMQDFIAISRSQLRGLEWIECPPAELASGDRVEIVDGAFSGVRGIMLHRNGRGRFVVSIEVAAVAVSLPAKYLKKV